MIFLEDIKLVLFDFDDTLCIHQIRKKGNSNNFNIAMLNRDINYWDCKNCYPNHQMKIFMKLCASIHVDMGLISAVTSCCEAENKIQWIFEKYGFKLKNYCTGNAENKINIIKALLQSSALTPQNILFVDDQYINILSVSELGLQTAMPLEIINYINDLKI